MLNHGIVHHQFKYFFLTVKKEKSLCKINLEKHPLITNVKFMINYTFHTNHIVFLVEHNAYTFVCIHTFIDQHIILY